MNPALQEHTASLDAGSDRTKYDYDYDAAYRLTGAQYPAIAGFALPASEGFAYDPAGNRDDDAEPDGNGDGTHTYDANNRITGSPGIVYVFDADGNLESTNDGGAPASTLTTLTWDLTNRLQKFERTSSGLEASYNYDPFGRRIRKAVDPDGPSGPAGTTTTWYAWDGDRLVTEYDGGDRKTRYAYAGGLAPLQVAHDDGMGGEEILEVHVDHLGAPRMLTDPGGTPVWRAVYAVAGAASVDEDPDGDQSEVAFNVRILGQYYDEESALHYNHQRYYDPVLGRYLSADPFHQLDGTNVYQYARNNPTGFVDPRGEFIQFAAVPAYMWWIGGAGVSVGIVWAWLNHPAIGPSSSSVLPGATVNASSSSEPDAEDSDDQPGGKCEEPPDAPPAGLSEVGYDPETGEITFDGETHDPLRDSAKEVGEPVDFPVPEKSRSETILELIADLLGGGG